MRKLPVAMVVTALLLAGCSAGSAPIAALHAAQSGRDALPAGKAESLGVIPESTHFAAEKDGYVFYLGRRAGGTDSCIVIGAVNDETGWVAACSTAVSDSAEVVTAQIRDVRATLVTDGFDPKDRLAGGWEQIHENILVSRP
jgi:hypothetical protein